MFKRLFGHSKMLRVFHLEVPHDDVYAFYEQLGLPLVVAQKHQLEMSSAEQGQLLRDLAQGHQPGSMAQESLLLNCEILGGANAAFSDGEIDSYIISPLGSKPRDRLISELFGTQTPTQGSFYRALQAERRKVEQSPDELSPAFEILQLYWGATLARWLAINPDELERLGFYSQIQRNAIAFAPVMSNHHQGKVLTLSKSEQID